MPRMNILNTVEREAFDSPPVLNSVERKHYFDFPSGLRRLAGNLRSPIHQLGFLLSAGYFKAAKRFFPPSTFHRRDIEHLVRQLELVDLRSDFADYNTRTRQFHEVTIRRFYGFRVFDLAASRLFLGEIAGMVRSQLKPKIIFWRCVEVLIRSKIEVPSYTRLTKLILDAIKRQKQELAAIIERTLTEDTRRLLDSLLAQEPVEGGDTPGRTSAYKLTLMKKLSQSTKPSKIKERVADLDLVKELYHQLNRALQALTLKPEGIRYYAHNVIRSKIFQLIRRDDPDRDLHLVAFIAHQYYRLQDNLVDVLLASLRSFQNGAIRAHKEQCYARREQRNESLKALLGGLEHGLVGTLTTIGSITEDRALSDAEKVTRIRALLAQRETRRLLENDPVAELKASLVSELDEDDYYEILESKSVWIQNRVSPILKVLTFQGDPSVRKLVDAIEHFKEKDGGVDKSAPTGFLDPEERVAVGKDGKFRVSLYKALLFLHVQNGIKSGALNLEHSYKYRPLDDYLIDHARWQRDKQQFIERAGLETFADPRKTLKELDEALYQQFLLTNCNIAEGKNPHITFKKNGGFTLATPKQEESDAEPLQQFFPERRFVPLVEVLATVNRFTHYADELQNPQQRYHHGKPSEAAIYAGLIGIGCAIGLRRMMRISRGITEAELEHTVNWHFTLDGLQAASDRVVRLTDRLDLPNLTRRSPDRLHTSSDGQKFEVRVDSLNANYSFKYFGKEQGVVAYTFREYVIGLMKDAGLSVRIDPAGNIFGHRDSSQKLPVILFGSQIDSVVHGGNYDGDVGSLGAIEVIRALNESGTKTRHPLEVVIWTNEEGNHFGIATLGSGIAAGLIGPEILHRKDDKSVTLAEWLRRYGQDPAKLADARIPQGVLAASLELDIEQGPNLYEKKIPIGVVQGIAAVGRWDCVVLGSANHAGTTPMNRRHNALAAASKDVLAVRDVVLGETGTQVGNVGFMKVEPGAPNVIPGRAEFPVELRDLDDAKVVRMWEHVAERFRQADKEEGVDTRCESTEDVKSARATPAVQAAIRDAAKSVGLASVDLPSFAGQDSQNIAKIAPMGMIFIPRKDGISHSPKEYSSPEDIANGAEVLYRTVLLLDQRLNP